MRDAGTRTFQESKRQRANDSLTRTILWILWTCESPLVIQATSWIFYFTFQIKLSKAGVGVFKPGTSLAAAKQSCAASLIQIGHRPPIRKTILHLRKLLSLAHEQRAQPLGGDNKQPPSAVEVNLPTRIHLLIYTMTNVPRMTLMNGYLTPTLRLWMPIGPRALRSQVAAASL